MKEQTHFFIKIYLSHFIIENVCERWVGDGDRLLHIDPKFFWPYQLHFFRILAGLLNRGSLRAQALCLELVLTPLASYLQLKLELTDPIRLWHLVIWLSDIHLLPVGVRICHHHRIQPRPQVKVIFRYFRPDAPVSLFFRLFTHVHLLIDGSVKGQYVTMLLKYCKTFDSTQYIDMNRLRKLWTEWNN